MSASVDDLTVNYVQDGVQTVKEEAKTVLTKGTWATIMYLYRNLDRKKGGFGPLRATIRRYQKRSGVYRQDSRFNISSMKQARVIADQLVKWVGEAEDMPEFIAQEPPPEGGEG